MKRGYLNYIFLLAIPAMLICLYSPVFAVDSAQPDQVIQKVNEAMNYILDTIKSGKKVESVFSEFNDPKGKWAWADTYVFIMKCENTALSTHPIKPALIGKDLSGLKDQNGNYFYTQMCETTKKTNGGWTEYLWPKPNETKASRKISYCRQVPGTPYQVGAGIYNETVSLKDLDKIIK